MEETTYYTAEEALEAGFIDVISDANLAAASIGDMESLKAFASIPQAKIDGIKIECQARQIEASKVQIEKMKNEIELHNEQVALIQNEANESKAQVETLKAERVEALATATEQTAKAIAQKAADLLAESGTLAVEDVIETTLSEEMDEETFWKEYNALKKSRDFQGAQQFYTENKSVIGQ